MVEEMPYPGSVDQYTERFLLSGTLTPLSSTVLP